VDGVDIMECYELEKEELLKQVKKSIYRLFAHTLCTCTLHTYNSVTVPLRLMHL